MMKTSEAIVQHLWFDKEADDAVKFYTSIFPKSRTGDEVTLHDTPSGDAKVFTFELMEQKFMAINAGPTFKFNPSVSFIVNFDPSREANAEQSLHEVWRALSDGGTVLMPLDQYPFSKQYGWIQDKFGLSWQLILSNPEGEERPNIVPSLMFAGDNCGKAEEAIQFYVSVFENARQGNIVRYPAGMEPDKEGTVMFADFALLNYWFAAMDSARNHTFQFNEAISFMVYCDTQEEIDQYWELLSAVPESEQCGWLKDQYGVSWQIVPRAMDMVMSSHSTPEQIARVNQELLKMKKIDLAKLLEAYEG